MTNENQLESITLGERLRRLTQESKLAFEIHRFEEVLSETAQQGINYYVFDDLRDYLPTLIMEETLFNWLSENELIYEGNVDNNTGKYRYRIKW